MKSIKILLLVLLIVSLGCRSKVIQLFESDHTLIQYLGRIDDSNKKEPFLIGSAAFVEMSFSGESCSIFLKNVAPYGLYNFIVLELDGQYLGRFKVEGEDMQELQIPISEKSESHILKVFKATEAQNGYVAFGGIKCKELKSLPARPDRRIEFIGNSITCGMGADFLDIPCGTDQWYDQHNGYLAYGPLVAKKLNAEFILSSVSGIGIYRNWNSNEPVMPDVYENTYLNTNDENKWNFSSYTPELVSICLGTNDFSDGDGINERLPFDSTEFVRRYIEFVNSISSKYPNAQICLLTSPMLSGEKGALLTSCLEAVQQNFSLNNPQKKDIAIYRFNLMEPKGCSYHPDINDHQILADELLPFYGELMGWNSQNN